MPKFFSRGDYDDREAGDQVKATLRYGQKIAIAQRRSISVTISSAGSTSCDLALSGSNISCAIKNDITLSAAPTIIFDALGRPTAGSTFSVGNTSLTIEAETGYVH
jgi:MSHA pilin protein MshC